MKKQHLRIVLLVCVLLNGTVVCAQRIDSLEKVIERTPDGDPRHIDAMNLLSQDLTQTNPYRAAQLAGEALEASLRTGYKKGQGYGYRLLASVFSNTDNNIIAEEYWQRAMGIFRAIDDSAGIANCFITRGNMMRRRQQREEELECHQKAFEIFSRMHISERIAVSVHNLGESYQLAGQDSLARELTAMAIRLNDSVNNISVLSNCYKVMGKLNLSSGLLSEAESDFKRVLKLSARLGPNSQKTATVEAMLKLAEIYDSRGPRDSVVSYYKQAAEFSSQNMLLNYLDSAYSGIIEFYGGDGQKVTEYTRQYRAEALETSLRLRNAKAELEKYGVEIYRLLQKQLLQLERDNSIKNQRIKNKNLLLGLFVAVMLALALLAFLQLQRIRERKKAVAEIRDQAEQLRLLTARIQNIREEERTRIAWEIHEGLGQKLIVINVNVAWLKEKYGRTDPVTESRFAELEQLIKSVILQVREIATVLRPGVLDDLGLAVAINWQLAEFEKRYDVMTELDDRLGDVELSENTRTGLFRIFQESLSNIGWHAHARKVKVLLEQKGNAVTMRISDDGKGFKLGEIASERSLGFLDMRERCHQMNGTFSLNSSPGKGTTINVEVPLSDT